MTPKQRQFAAEYVKTNNVLQSALAAGYSEHYAKTKGKVLLGHTEIVAEIQRLRNKLNERADKNATDVVNEYAKIAFVDRVDFLKPDPHCPGEYIYKAPDELTEEQRSIVEKVTMRNKSVRVADHETGEINEFFRQEYNYVLSDKANALQQMGRHFGIFDDKLKLVQHQQNPFKNATPEQLEKLRSSIVGIMAGDTIDGEYEEVKNMLPDGQGRTGTRG
jgi:phage terminase small subunit